MDIRLIYLRTLKILNSGELILKSGDKWVLPHYPDATIIGDSLLKYGYISELLINKSNETNNLEFYTITQLGRTNYEIGREWWDSLSLFQKFILHFMV